MHRSDRTPRVVFQPQTHQALGRGIAQIADAVRPTLGPGARSVMIGREAVEQPPILFDSGGLIARRIVEIRNNDEDMGAMLLRDMLWHLHKEVGDGTATAAVMCEAIYHQGVRYLAAGGNVSRLRRYLETGSDMALALLAAMSMPVVGREQLGRLAESSCHDPELAKLLGEIFDVIGQFGHLEIRTRYGRGLEREYVEGMYWEGGILARQSFTDTPRRKATLEDAAILISDLPLETPEDVLPVLKLALAARARSLIIVTPQVSARAISCLLANTRPDAFQPLAVKTPGVLVDAQAVALDDLAILTGGRPLLKASGASLQRVRWEDLGHARRVWANQSRFGVVGGKGSPVALRQHIAALRAAFARTQDSAARDAIQQRLGKLMGGAATLWIGGISDTEIQTRKGTAERTANVLRGAVSEGALPGGGVACLACSVVLHQVASQSTDPDERAAHRILSLALEAPFRALLLNAGYEPGGVLAQMNLSSPRHGFDVLTGHPVDMIEAGILDSSSVVRAAVRRAIGTAALALTIDVLVHRRQPELVTEP